MPGPPHHDGQGCPVRWSGRQAVVALPGRVDLSSAGPVAEQLLAVLGRGAAVLIADMTATRSCDHAAAGALARAYQRAVAHGTELRLVIPAAAVRRAVTLSGLDQLVSVFPTLEAAQAAHPPAAVVLPLPPRVADNRSATPPPTDGQRPVTRLPVASPARLDGSGRAAQQGMRPGDYEDTLTRVTDGIFRAGLTLQAALGQPPGGLRRAAEHTLDLLDETVRAARDAAFASHRPAAPGLPGAADPGAAARLGPDARSGSPKTVDSDLVRLSRLRAMQARRIRAQSQKARTRTRQIAALSAAAHDRIAASLGELADSQRGHSANLQALSQAAASRAALMRHWAHSPAATG